MTVPRFSSCITRAKISAAEADSLSTSTTTFPGKQRRFVALKFLPNNVAKVTTSFPS
jgi:hypothetical protein